MKNFADIHLHMTDLSFEKCGDFLELIASQGVTHAGLMSLTYRSVVYNLSMLYWKEHFKKMQLCVYGMVHNQDFYDAIPFEVQAKALIDMGCDGIKFMYAPDIRRKMGHSIADARYDAMFSYLEENDIPMLIHVNDPDEFWIPRPLTPYEIERGWGYFREGYLTKQEIYDEMFTRLDRHPRLRVTFAHFFFLGNFIDEATRVFEKYPNVNFDLTPGTEMFRKFSTRIDDWHDFFEKYADRILFGTDSNNIKSPDLNRRLHTLVRTTLAHDTSEFEIVGYRPEKLRGLALSDRTMERICFENYMRFVGTPKPVNMPLVRQAAERVRADIAGMEGDAMEAAAAWLTEFAAKTAD